MIARRALPMLLLPVAARAAVPGWVASLRGGGFVLYMRHAITDRAQADTGRLFDRAGQRNLSAAGIAQAQAISAAVARLAVPLGLVRSSPVYRASDTAAIMARGRPVDVTMELVADDYAADVPAAIASARRALCVPPAAGTNTLLVGHIVPFGAAIGRSLSQSDFPEGAIGVVRPRPPSDFTVERILAAEAIIAAAG